MCQNPQALANSLTVRQPGETPHGIQNEIPGSPAHHGHALWGYRESQARNPANAENLRDGNAEEKIESVLKQSRRQLLKTGAIGAVGAALTTPAMSVASVREESDPQAVGNDAVE
jgi:hypothetical protein